MSNDSFHLLNCSTQITYPSLPQGPSDLSAADRRERNRTGGTGSWSLAQTNSNKYDEKVAKKSSTKREQCPENDDGD